MHGGHFQSCIRNDKGKNPAINGNIKYLDQEILVSQMLMVTHDLKGKKAAFFLLMFKPSLS